MAPPFGSRQQRVEIQASDVDNFAPELLMTPQELKAVRSLVRREPTYDELGLGLSEKARTPKQRAAAVRRVEIDRQRCTLASDVLRRCDFDIYMVLHIVREDKLEIWIQAHEFDIRPFGMFNQLAWRVTGVALRKDKSIGSKAEYGSFRAGCIERRWLDGRWTRIKPRGGSR